MTHNQKGLTLVEVLAGIVLLSIITTLTTMILIQIFKNDETATEEISLKQNSNVILSSLSQAFNETDMKDICINTQPGITINEEKSVVTSGKSNNKLKSGCIVDIDREKPLHVDLYIENTAKTDHLVVETTLVKSNQQTVMLTQDEADKIPCISKPDASFKRVNELACNQTGNVLWNGKKTNCNGPIKINGNIYVDDDLKKEKFILEVLGDVHFKKDVELKKNSKLTATGTACFKKEAEFKESDVRFGNTTEFRDDVKVENSIMFTGNPNANLLSQTFFKKDVDFKKSSATMYGNAIFTKEFDFDGDSKNPPYTFIVTNDALFKDEMDFEDGTFSIGRNATFEDEVDFDDSTASIDGDGTFDDEVDLDHTTLNIHKNLISKKEEFELKNSSEVTVGGSASFEKKVKINQGSTLCIKNGTNNCSAQN